MKFFVDTNIFLRTILQDDKKKAKDCLKFFEAIDAKKIFGTTSPFVLNEIVWVLEGLKIKGSFIVKRIGAIQKSEIEMLGCIENKFVSEVIELYEKQDIDFIDAYHAVLAREEDIENVVSYDKHFDRIAFIKRYEPDKI